MTTRDSIRCGAAPPVQAPIAPVMPAPCPANICPGALAAPAADVGKCLRYPAAIVIELRLIRHALVLGKHRSFARAAAALHLTQPSLSRSIASG